MKHTAVRLLAICLAASLLAGGSTALAAEAEAESKTITVTDFRAEDDSFLQIRVGEETIVFLSSDSGLPYLDENSRVQIPVRRFAEATGGTVEYHHEDLSVTITCGEDVIGFALDSNIMTCNGVAEEMDTTAQIFAGRTYIPLRAIAEALGYTVEYAREEAKSPEYRIVREDVASIKIDDGYPMHNATQKYYLTENETDIFVELFNQMCMSSPWHEVNPFDTVQSYHAYPAYIYFKDGEGTSLYLRGNELRYRNIMISYFVGNAVDWLDYIDSLHNIHLT